MPIGYLEAVGAGLAVAAVAAFTAIGIGHVALPRHALEPMAHTVEIAAGAFEFTPPGEFLAAGRPVAAPRVQAEFRRPLRIMRHQVSLADYQTCVDAGACQPADAPGSASPAITPVTGVSYLDAMAYAEWLSRASGNRWRLPTAVEWAFAAAERFRGDAYSPTADDPANPSTAWIRRYQEEAAAGRQPDPQPKPQGFFGPNSRAVEDLAGNIWEWTSTCYSRVGVSGGGREISRTDNCGVHVVEGRHRAYMSNFIRDGKSGGCAVGTPPDNLGFRLLLEPDAGPPTI